MTITQNRLRELVKYDPKTGVFTRVLAVPGKRAGSTCGCRHFEGYTAIKLDGKSYMAHRLAFLYVTGENQQNKTVRKDNKSGFAGVTWDAQASCWRARISVQGRQYFLGHFDVSEVAAAAYRDAKAAKHSFNPQVPS